MKKLISIIIICIILNMLTLPVFADGNVYRVAGDYKFPPYEYVDMDGIFKGFNVDMLKAISLVTGMNFEFIPMRWEDAYNSIENGQAEIIQGMKDSEERREKFLFSNSLLMNSQSIFVLDKSMGINYESDLVGKTVALMSRDSAFRRISNKRGIKIIEYETLDEALDALLDSKVDAMIGNTLVVNYLCKEKDTIDLIKIVGNALNEQKYAMAVAKGNHDLMDKLNTGLKEIQKNGMYELIYRKWFGTPIKNTQEQYDLYLKISIAVCIALTGIIFAVHGLNQKLKKIIDTKIDEQKVLVNELRHYDKLQFMDKIISSVAHEIRNPLTSIKIYTGQMKDKIDNKEFMIAASEDIPAEIDRIDALIKEFVEYTSPRKPLITNINLYEEIMSTIKLVKLQIKNIDITIDVDKLLYIKFDINHFKQIILNILLNNKDALKDTLEPKIEIVAEEKEKNIVLYIKDNGHGMDKEKLQYIFEPFFTTKSSGNGIGMFIVKQMVEDNGGTISAESDGEFQGMCIIITAEKGDIYEK